jgi:hypothetical protein
MRTEDLVMALFLCTLERVGEERDCFAMPNDINDVDWMYSLSNDGIDNGCRLSVQGMQMRDV